MLEDRADDFLALLVQLRETLGNVRYRRLRSRFFWRHRDDDCVPHLAVGDPLAWSGREIGTGYVFAAVLVSNPGATNPGATTGCRKGIMARNLGPSCSMGWVCSRWRVARK